MKTHNGLSNHSHPPIKDLEDGEVADSGDSAKPSHTEELNNTEKSLEEENE